MSDLLSRCLEKFPPNSKVKVCSQVPSDVDGKPSFNESMRWSMGEVLEVKGLQLVEGKPYVKLSNGFNYLPHWFSIHCACEHLMTTGCTCGAMKREKIKLQ